jgi:general secretion pathway protein C
LLAGAWSSATLIHRAYASENEQRATITVRAQGKTGEVTRTKTDKPGEATLPEKTEGGTIPRSALKAELDRGIGRFFQQVKPEPVVSHRHLIGWRITALFPNRSDVHVGGIEIGDIVLRVNGAQVERPEDFIAIWDTLADAKDLTIDIDRGGEVTSVHYSIQ